MVRVTNPQVLGLIRRSDVILLAARRIWLVYDHCRAYSALGNFFFATLRA